MKNKRYWTVEEIEILRKYFPHIGAMHTAAILKRGVNAVSHKASRLNIKLIQPREKRLCRICFKNYQTPFKGSKSANKGSRCDNCYSKHNKHLKATAGDLPIDQHFRSLVNKTSKSQRNKNRVFNITVEELLQIWEKQKGLCYYSGQPMITRIYGKPRQWNVCSMDQRVPKAGYTKENIVLCCWQANAAKDEFLEDQLYEFCKRVTEYQQSK